ncbi:hypothetical protein GMLC_20650 [Geomonas limicola]|uniref:NRDE family protein n=1 Tax=Geomonas limicola TaxID=2740186 RepID=A0A6V8N7D9_9BACT|nr:NRDE family protein [Geomonas limicola]GFO68486.1 hypothetical protein GMLC_20650 [Geomonas limicola]
MCLILMAYRQHPRYPLIIAANRDEFYERPTRQAGFWEESPDLLAGRDLLRGGTWLGVNRDGRIAALTNYREPHQPDPTAPSRGDLVSDFLNGTPDPQAYLERLRREGGSYHGFNLIFGTPDALSCYSNRSGEVVRVEPGFHGLSNRLWDTPWPKVVRGKSALRGLLQQENVAPEALLDLLHDRTPAPDEDLPETGVGLEWERLLAPMFIASERYGTRSSTAILVDYKGTLTFAERRYEGGDADEVEFTFELS